MNPVRSNPSGCGSHSFLKFEVIEYRHLTIRDGLITLCGMNKNTISISEARSRLFNIAEKVQTPGVYFTFTDKGRPKTVIMSADEYESIIETLEVVRDFPDLDKTITKVDKDIKSGAYLNYPILDDILAEEGYVLNNKANKHGISTTHRTKRAKKS